MRHIIGRWAVCQHGVLGKVNTVTVKDGATLASGITRDNKPWQSTDPRYLSPAESEALDEIIHDAWVYGDLSS
jgi:hypothetical protein